MKNDTVGRNGVKNPVSPKNTQRKGDGKNLFKILKIDRKESLTTVANSDQHIMGVSDQHVMGVSDQHTIGVSGQHTMGVSDQHTMGVSGQHTIDVSDQ